MNSLRLPFLIVALVLIGLVVLAEMGGLAASLPSLLHGLDHKLPQWLTPSGNQQAPGLGIYSMAVLDCLVLFTGLLIISPLIVSHRVHAKFQGIATLLVSLLTLLTGMGMILLTLAKLMLMIGLLLAIPFGTLAYLAIYADFDRGLATGMLSGLMTCKLGFAVCLVLAQQDFVKNKGLVLILLTSLLANIVVSFLQALVPGFLVSITDAIAAIVVLILAVVWGLFFLIGSIPAIFKLALSVKNAGSAAASAVQ